MKKIISKILVFIMIFSSIPFVSFDTLASMPKADAMDGYQNLSLAYTFMYNGEDCGRQTVNDFLPLTGYKDKQGTIVDYFFDSFLFLPCNGVGPSGARMHSKEGDPTLEIDWKTYVEDTFYKGKNVDALDIGCIDGVETKVGRNTVDNHERVTVIDGTKTTDLDVHIRSRRT